MYYHEINIFFVNGNSLLFVLFVHTKKNIEPSRNYDL
jgi:hypothetical protein